MPGRSAAIRRSYRLAPDVIQRIEEIAQAESTTATTVIEAAVRAYRGTLEARVAALESWKVSVEGRLGDASPSPKQGGR